MEIKFHGHSCFELSEGEATLLIDPFLKPNNPAAVATAEEVDPTHIAITHGHADHMADAVPVAKRTGAHCVGDRRARRTGSKGQGVENVSDPNLGGTVELRLGLDQAGPRLAHQHAPRLRRGAVQRRARDPDRHRRRAS